jgi:hypothetical protein
MNYGGAIRNYLGSIGSGDHAYQFVQDALKQSDRYLDGLKSAGDIKEFHPSEHERQTERVRFFEEMQKAQKEAMKKSVILNLIKRSVILYGKRSITYIPGPNDTTQPLEMELKNHGVTMEFPRMEVTDPVGLNLGLRMFRAERLKP